MKAVIFPVVTPSPAETAQSVPLTVAHPPRMVVVPLAVVVVTVPEPVKLTEPPLCCVKLPKASVVVPPEPVVVEIVELPGRIVVLPKVWLLLVDAVPIAKSEAPSKVSDELLARMSLVGAPAAEKSSRSVD